MADTTTDPKVDAIAPANEEPKLATTETDAATATAEKSATDGPVAVCLSSHGPSLEDLFDAVRKTDPPQTLTEQASGAAAAAAATTTAAASAVADNVFSMFGGGAKKEKKDEDEDRGETSGSAKAQKEAAAEENPEVRSTTDGDTLQNADDLRVG
jgi:hypothetical protein